MLVVVVMLWVEGVERQVRRMNEARDRTWIGVGREDGRVQDNG